VLELALYGFKRLDRVLEQVDDSGGYRFTTQVTLCELHVAALARLAWPAERKAEHLLDLASQDEWDQFSGVPDRYLEALGEDGLAAFYSAVETRLDTLPPLPAGADFNAKYPYLRLTHYLEARAEASEDWDALIALAKRTATNDHDYQRIASLYLRQKDADSAADWLAKADEVVGKGRNSSASLWVEVHVAREDWAAAVDAHRRVFESQPSYALYLRLVELAGLAGSETRIKRDTAAWLRAGHKTGWLDNQYAYTLAQILCEQQDWEGAYEALAGRVQEPAYLIDGARWLAIAAPALACKLYAVAIEAAIQKKTKRGYQTGVDILAEAEPVFDAVDSDAFGNFVEDLRQRHRQKRNFVAALEELD
jgi:hypothetical protein